MANMLVHMDTFPSGKQDILEINRKRNRRRTEFAIFSRSCRKDSMVKINERHMSLASYNNVSISLYTWSALPTLTDKGEYIENCLNTQDFFDKFLIE